MADVSNDSDPMEMAAALLAELEAAKTRRSDQLRDILMPQVSAWLGADPVAQDAIAVVESILRMFVGSSPPAEAAGLLANMRTSADRLRHRRRALVRSLRAVPGLLGLCPSPAVAAEALAPLAATWLTAEPGLEGLADDLASLSARLLRISPTRALGKITAERALAEFIYDERDALGIVVNLDEDPEIELERIRKLLVRDTRDG